jgi:hypothetical protein
MGDEGCEEIARSGILKRLKMLDLRHGRISDAGARVLAGCSDLRRLEYLDLDLNELSPDGIALVKSLGIAARVDHQHTKQELDPDSEQPQYLCEGEFE